MNIKNLLFLLAVVALTLSFNACSKDNSTDVWHQANMDAYNTMVKDSAQYYKEITTETGPLGVYRRVITSGTGTEYPLQTSKVKVLYNGKYYDGTYFDLGSSKNDSPVEFSVGSTVRGFSFALQQMVVGDKWVIWIPYYLGYGPNDYYDPNTYQLLVKGYSTLIFEVELVSITQYP